MSANALLSIKNAIEMQGITRVIKPFAGDPAQFDEWIKEIEKFMRLTHQPAGSKHLIAYQASAGLVSDFIGRFLEEERDPTWERLLPQIRTRFAGIKDNQHALALLSRVRQGKSESVPIYAERVHALAREAFPGDHRGNNTVGKQVVGYFVDGLRKDRLKMKVLRADPEELTAAVDLATKEDNLEEKLALRLGDSKRYGPVLPRRDPPYGPATPRRDPPRDPRAFLHTGQAWHSGEEPMEVDHLRANACFKCGGKGHRARECATKEVRAVQRHSRDAAQTAASRVCWRCGEAGHFKRDCPKATSL